MSDLKTLEANKDAILLAEVIGWLHDYRKCSDEQLKVQSINLNNQNGLQRDELTNRYPALQTTNFSIISSSEIISDLLNSRDTTQSFSLKTYLSRCHYTAHFDKQDPDDSGKQNYPDTKISSVFGYERLIPNKLTSKLWSINWAQLSNYKKDYRSDLRISVSQLFSHVGADTRRPINEISLWDWGFLVGALYKASLAGLLLGYSPTPNDLRWRLLSIRFDGFGFFGKTNRISDLLARRNLLEKALDNVRNLLEIEYPLGTEIYRDENGSIFVVPGCEKGNCTLDLLDLKAGGKTLEELIQNEIEKAIDKELVPNIRIDKQPWWGQDPDWSSKKNTPHLLQNELPPITDHLKPFSTFSDPDWVDKQWQVMVDGKYKLTNAEVCTVCGVRPQGYGTQDWDKHRNEKHMYGEKPLECQVCKAQNRAVCQVCEKRREDRSKIWAQARHEKDETRTPWQQTIWIDEVADKNGRLALIVGKFELTEWLNGNMIQTLLVTKPPDYHQKNPSFARIQRVWRTTQKFWKQVEEQDIPSVVKPDHQRVEIVVSFKEGNKPLEGKYHAYDAEMNGRRITLVWDSEKQCLLTSVNLTTWIEGGADSLSKQLRSNDEIQLYESGGYGQKRNLLGTVNVIEAKVIPIPYTPIIPLLSQPASFMMLVPASKALKVAQKISQRYELEMSKVRNRLPLLLGTIFFDKRQPFFSALDAGRRLLTSKFNTETCQVTCNCARLEELGDQPPCYLKETSSENELSKPKPHFMKWHELRLTTEKGNSLLWRASTVMGDGTTLDDWYPYVHVVKDCNNQIPKDRKQFEHPKDSGQLWVHVSDVLEGDTVKYIPSRFTWLHLDTSARRFVVLDDDRIQPLEELERITGLWEHLKKKDALTQSQLQAVVSLLATKREKWNNSPEQFKQLVETTLHIEGLDGVSLDDVISGRLERTFELHHHILKEKVKEKNSVGDHS